MDHLGTLNDTTPRIRISEDKPVQPDVVFGLDTKLFEARADEGEYWAEIGKGAGWHGDEVETKTVWRGGGVPGRKRRKVEHSHEHDHEHKENGNGDACGCHHDAEEEEVVGEVQPVDKAVLEQLLEKLSFEIYRGAYSLRCVLPVFNDD